MDDQPEISILDSRLAEIDRRLHMIQSGLDDEASSVAPAPRVEVPGEAGRPTGSLSSVPAPETARPESALVARLRELTTAQESVLSSIRELLGAVERVAMAEPRAPVPVGTPFSVSAGPFASTEALRSFQAALQSLPEVRSVELRGFEGGDRAILDVHL
ncbi:MAG: hypothetical protein ABI323_08920 [Solirubrobacteraceae bacterium]